MATSGVGWAVKGTLILRSAPAFTVFVFSESGILPSLGAAANFPCQIATKMRRIDVGKACKQSNYTKTTTKGGLCTVVSSSEGLRVEE